VLALIAQIGAGAGS